MEALTPASPDSLPPLGEQIADDLFWRYRAGRAGEGVAHLQVWTTTGPEPGHLAVVTETGSRVAESAAHIRAELARRYGPSLVLLEHHPAPETGEGAETLEPGPRRHRRQPALDPHLANPGGQPSPPRTGTVDGYRRVPDRQQAGESLRLV